jgi:hypothetical protein
VIRGLRQIALMFVLAILAFVAAPLSAHADDKSGLDPSRLKLPKGPGSMFRLGAVVILAADDQTHRILPMSNFGRAFSIHGIRPTARSWMFATRSAGEMKPFLSAAWQTGPAK